MRLASASPRGVGNLTTSPAASAIRVLPRSPDVTGIMGVVAPRTEKDAVFGLPLIAGDGPPGWLGCGQALARVLLRVTAAGGTAASGRRRRRRDRRDRRGERTGRGLPLSAAGHRDVLPRRRGAAGVGGGRRGRPETPRN